MARTDPPAPDPQPMPNGSSAGAADPVACFVCAANRPSLGVGGALLEDLMHNNDCAAMWEYPPDVAERVRYLERMQRVGAGDLIFMFAAGEGIIGVGRATAGCRGPLPPGHHQRLRAPSWAGEEWQVSVEWLRWQPDNPCPFQGFNATFYEITGPSETWDERREAVLAFFGLV